MIRKRQWCDLEAPALAIIGTIPPHPTSFDYGLRATDMDRLATNGRIADALMTSRRGMATYKASKRTGRAKFLSLDGERDDICHP
jgi:hypothetical protein